MLRHRDNKPILIDFGAVKEIAQQIEQVGDTQSGDKVTVAIGTDGFMAPEQALGQPRFSSDIYSVGIVGILALTGMSARELNQTRDRDTNEFCWREHVQVSYAFAAIIDKMVRYNHTDRYQSATEVLADVKPLFEQTRKLWEQANLAERCALPLEDATPPFLEATKAWPEPFSADSRSSDPDADIESLDSLNNSFNYLVIAMAVCFNHVRCLDHPSTGLLFAKVLLVLLRSPHQDQSE